MKYYVVNVNNDHICSGPYNNLEQAKKNCDSWRNDALEYGITIVPHYAVVSLEVHHTTSPDLNMVKELVEGKNRETVDPV
jgi:hypothetical protein